MPASSPDGRRRSAAILKRTVPWVIGPSSHRGFSENNPPKDPDLERVPVVKEFMELWANSLHAAGIPREKIFCHIAFTSQGLDPDEEI